MRYVRKPYKRTTGTKFICVGPGGMTCTCCFPAPRSKERKYKFRQAKEASLQRRL